MKHAIAIVLLCLPAQLSGGQRCPASQANRDEIARTLVAKSAAHRIETARPQKARRLLAWQRAVLFEQQIL